MVAAVVDLDHQPTKGVVDDLALDAGHDLGADLDPVAEQQEETVDRRTGKEEEVEVVVDKMILEIGESITAIAIGIPPLLLLRRQQAAVDEGWRLGERLLQKARRNSLRW